MICRSGSLICNWKHYSCWYGVLAKKPNSPYSLDPKKDPDKKYRRTSSNTNQIYYFVHNYFCKVILKSMRVRVQFCTILYEMLQFSMQKLIQNLNGNQLKKLAIFIEIFVHGKITQWNKFIRFRHTLRHIWYVFF